MIALSVVIPTYKGECTLDKLLMELDTVLQDIKCEIIIVDDGSPEETWKIISELYKKFSNKEMSLRCIRLKRNYGQQTATLAGLSLSEGEWVITMDDDLEHNPRDILKLYAEALKGFELVYAVPKKRRYSFFRKIGSLSHELVFWFLCRKPLEFRITSFRILHRSLVEKIRKTEQSFIYISTIAFAHNPKVSFITTVAGERQLSRYQLPNLLSLYLKLLIFYGLKIPGGGAKRSHFRIKEILQVCS